MNLDIVIMSFPLVGITFVLVFIFFGDTKLLAPFFCMIGMHGPNWKGIDSCRTGVPFERQCPHCKKKWWGTEVSSLGYRTVGDFQTEEQLKANGLWNYEYQQKEEK